MCGLTGYVNSNISREVRLDAAVDFLHARGPDERGVWYEGPVGLGHTRLSIIDLGTGQQPMVSADGRYVIVFNGEIYNFQTLRAELEQEGLTFRTHSDTEILLTLFVTRGIDACLSKLRGMFAFAIWDRHEQLLTLARDRLGVKPLVYSETSSGFLFASEIGALFALDPNLSRDIDPQAIDAYLTFQYIPAPRTGFASVRKLAPAHAMVVRRGRVERCWRYWSVDAERRSTLSIDDACEAVREKVLEATRLRLVSDVPLGAFLSGGVDSSITVAAMARLQGAPVKTFSIGFEEQRFNELPYARQVAQHFGTEHHEFIVRPDAATILPQLITHVSEPLADDSILPTFFVSQQTRSHVTVALTGDGADESFGGYRRFYQIGLLEQIEKLGLLPVWRGLRRTTVALENLGRRRNSRFPATRIDQSLYLHGIARYRHLLAFFTDEERPALYSPAFHQRLAESRSDSFFEDQYAATVGADPLTRYMLLDLATYLPEDVLVKVDIASMQNSLECRSPFLDHELVELAASLPASYKLRRFPKEHKVILKRAFQSWMPPGFFDRPKQGFSAPVSQWLRGQLWPTVERLLLHEQRLAPLLRQEVVEQYVEGHRSGKAPSGRRVWALLVLAEWLHTMRVTL